jgi:tetratricopeptide (TPR) repeat protein
VGRDSETPRQRLIPARRDRKERGYGDARRLHRRATSHRVRGEYAKARRLCVRSLRVLERAGVSQSPDSASVLKTLGAIHEDRSEYAEAERCYRRCVAILAAARGPVAARLGVQSLGKLANIHRVRGRYREAALLFRRALRAATATFDPDDPEVGALLNDRAVLYKYQGRFREARRLYRRALSDHAKRSRPGSPRRGDDLSQPWRPRACPRPVCPRRAVRPAVR